MQSPDSENKAVLVGPVGRCAGSFVLPLKHLAWLLAQAFRTTPELWMNLQVNHDLGRHRPEREIHPLVPPL